MKIEAVNLKEIKKKYIKGFGWGKRGGNDIIVL